MTEQDDTAFLTALVKLHADLPIIEKNAENDHFKSKFADLASIIKAVRPVLTKHGFALVQLADHEGETPTLVTVLWHISGGSIRSTTPLYMSKTDAQGYGSSLTYAKRYAISSMLLLATEEDDDGNAASEPPTQRRPSPRQSHTVSEEF